MDLHFLLQELKIDDFILVGWSLGGAIALSFLHSYPGRTKKAILLNTTSQSVADEHYRWGRTSQQQSDLLTLIDSDFLKYLQAETQASIPEIADGSDRLREQIRSLIEQTGKDVVRRQMEDFSSFSLRHDLSSIQTEILILCGGQDQVIDPRNSFDLRQHLPHSEIIELAQAGHAPHLTFAHEFNRLVSNFAQGRRMKCSIIRSFE
jgi:pimeloyl-ACP methyl ester carboxylesterase